MGYSVGVQCWGHSVGGTVLGIHFVGYGVGTVCGVQCRGTMFWVECWGYSVWIIV